MDNEKKPTLSLHPRTITVPVPIPHARVVRRHLLLLPRAREPREPHHGAELQHVLLPRHRLVLLAELPCEHLASVDVLRADEVASHFDGI